MKTTLVVATLGFVLPCMSGAEETTGQSVKFEFGTTLNAVLSDTVDARRSKVGDTVKAKTSEDLRAGGVIVIPRGTKLVGHVTEAQPVAKAEDQARLGIVFDRADLKGGLQIPLRTTFYALAAPRGASGDPGSSSAGGFGGGFGGGGSGVGDMVNAASRVPPDDTGALGAGRDRLEELKPLPGAVGGLNSSGILYASSRGVFGLENISLEPNIVPSSGSSVILANGPTVHLSSGTRMLLSVESADKP